MTQKLIDLVNKLNIEFQLGKSLKYLTSFYRDQIMFGDKTLYDSHLDEPSNIEQIEIFVREGLTAYVSSN